MMISVKLTNLKSQVSINLGNFNVYNLHYRISRKPCISVGVHYSNFMITIYTVTVYFLWAIFS